MPTKEQERESRAAYDRALKAHMQKVHAELDRVQSMLARARGHA